MRSCSTCSRVNAAASGRVEGDRTAAVGPVLLMKVLVAQQLFHLGSAPNNKWSLSVSSEFDRAIQNYTRFDDWYLWVQMHKGTVSMPVFQSLEAFWPGLQVQSGPQHRPRGGRHKH